MSTVKTEKPATLVVTGMVRLSYPKIWEPGAVKNDAGEETGDSKYGVCLLIPKTDTKTVANINKAIDAAKEAGKAKFGGKIPATLKLPLRDGDEEKPEDPASAGMWFLNASSDGQPGIVDRKGQKIINRDEVYAGCWIFASINFFAFNKKSKGIAAGLNNIMFAKDGERLSGKSDAAEDFADLINSDAAEDFKVDDDFL